METTLDRIADREPVLKAYSHLDPDAALEAARRVDRDGLSGPLAGIPVGVKDIFDTCDMPTTYGSPLYAGHRPRRDAGSVAAIRAAGGVIVGKTVSTEFAFMAPAATTNPHNSGYTPGGSSSGSAATVAAGGAPMALGTQTAGSIIRPAAFCGVVGFKPSFGLISRGGVASFGETLDTVGGFATNVSDAARLIGAMSGWPALIGVEAAPTAPTLGLWRTPEWASAELDVQSALEAAADRAAAAGARIVELDDPLPWAELQAAHRRVMAYEGARALGHEMRETPEGLSEKLRSFLIEGQEIDPEGYFSARRVARANAIALAQLFDGLDGILTLSAPGAAPEGLETTGVATFNQVWTLLGGPAIHLPTALTPAGLPVGVQVVGRMNEDAALARCARWLEAALA